MQYIGAGLDPARFWDITPRLYALEMEGCTERDRRARAMVWWGAYLPWMKQPPKFDEFVHGRRAASLSRAVAAFDRLDQALMRKQ